MKKTLTIIIAGLILSSCGNTEITANDTTSDNDTIADVIAPASNDSITEAVTQHHLAAFGSGDMDDLMSDYTEESIIITPEATVTGLEQIRGLFEKLGSMFPAEGSEFALDRMDVNNELAYIIWHANTPIVSIPLGTDTYVVTDGKIMKQTFAAKVEMK
jgi:hypothetical protein